MMHSVHQQSNEPANSIPFEVRNEWIATKDNPDLSDFIPMNLSH